jgi:hypothetical protein
MTSAERTSHGSFGKEFMSGMAGARGRAHSPLPARLHARGGLHGHDDDANWISSRPRFLLPAVLLALPLAKLAAPLRTPVLVGLIAALTVVSTRFGLYLLVITGWAP